MNKVSNILWGLVLIIVGVIFALNALEITNITIFFEGWWTLFIIVPCFIELFRDQNKTGNLIGLFIGIFLFLACQSILDFDLVWRLMVPVVLVLFGLSLIFKDAFNKKITKQIKLLSKSNDKEYNAVFSGQNIDYTKEAFDGCTINAIFGGAKCYLKESEIKKDCVVTVSTIFGGATVYVPDNVNVKITSTSIFGGVSDERRNKKYDEKITVYINATCIFGGVEVK